jgi:TonB family protein
VRILFVTSFVALTACAGRIHPRAPSPQAESRAADVAQRLAACQEKASEHERTGWASAAYFKRISCRVAEHWTAQGRDFAACEEADHQGAHAAVDLYLRPDGSVDSMAISKSSGHAAWDAAATSAVKNAGPFATPPPSLLAPSGLARLGFRFTCVRPIPEPTP